MARFNAVVFVGGPLDGVCWPCVLDPDAIAIKTAGGRLHLYECDLETEYTDGTKEYRMTPAIDAESAAEDFLSGLPAPWVKEK